MDVLLSKLNHRSSPICNYFLGTNPNVAILLIRLYNFPMTKEQLVQMAGSQSELARILKISRAAVCLWKAVPELRMRQLKDLRPEWFTQEKTWKKHFWRFGSRHQPQWFGHLAHTALIRQMVGCTPVQLAAMEIIAIPTVIDVTLFETRLGWAWSPNRKASLPACRLFLCFWRTA